MRGDLHWSFATAGAMNTANAVGYLAGALAAPMVARRCGARRGFVVGLGVTVVSLLATAGTGGTVALVALRALRSRCSCSPRAQRVVGDGVGCFWPRSESWLSA